MEIQVNKQPLWWKFSPVLNESYVCPKLAVLRYSSPAEPDSLVADRKEFYHRLTGCPKGIQLQMEENVDNWQEQGWNG